MTVGRRSQDLDATLLTLRWERACLFEAEVVEALIEAVEVAASVVAAATTTSEVEVAAISEAAAAAISEAAAAEEDLDVGVAAEALIKAKTRDLQNM